jgi:quinol-cytochrome oxidoreductase complex cytochrome b subunit
MTKEVKKKESLFANSVAAGFAALMAAMVMIWWGISKPSEDTSIYIFQALLYGCIFTFFYFFTSRFFNWLYSLHDEKV